MRAQKIENPKTLEGPPARAIVRAVAVTAIAVAAVVSIVVIVKTAV